MGCRDRSPAGEDERGNLWWNQLPGRAAGLVGLSELVLTSLNPGPPLRLGVRIDDVNSAADRGWLSDEAWLETGLSEVRIPLHRVPEPGDKRAIDWTRIGRLVLFVDKSEIPVEFSLQSAVLR